MQKNISEEHLQAINEIIQENAKIQKQDFTDENKMLCIYLHDTSMQPRECAAIFNRRYGSLSDGTLHNGDKVIKCFHGMGLRKIDTRKEIFDDCMKAAKLIIKALQENSAECLDADFHKLIKGHGQKKRITLMTMSELSHQIGELECREIMYKLNKGFSADCIEAIIALLSTEEKIDDIKPEEYEREIVRLQHNLNRANRMIERLQSDFDEQLEECKLREQIDLISKLNSRQYGYILDMLVLAQNGFRKLRRERRPLPVEISSVPVLTRKILQFVEDCGIEPISDIGTELDITSADLDSYDYDGTPFRDDSEVKTVTVMSNGWEMPDRNFVLSNPRVKEKEAAE